MSTVSEPAGVNEPAGVGLVHGGDDIKGLSGHMGVIELIFTVVAYNGPIVVFLGFLPVMILIGNGVGTPVAILACGVIVLMVAVGLIKMASRLDRPGGFYALITAGLGRVVGLGAGFAALTCYFFALISVYALGGIAMDGVVETLLNGPHVAWWVWALGMLVIAGALGYFNINLSAKVLTVFLFAELLLMAAYDVSVIFQGGAHGIHFDSFTPDQVRSGSLAIAFLFGIGLFGGFEATVIFRDEVKDPKRTIPRATYGVIALLAGMYSITSWCLINGYGANAVMAAVENNLVGLSTDSIKQYTGNFAYDLATIMLFTSSFALVLASHNITSRYIFNMAADGIFPKKLGEPHERHVSPHRASILLSVLSLVAIFVVVGTGMSNGTIYARLAGLFSYAFLMLLVAVAAAVGVFLLRDRANGPAMGAAISAFVACVIFAWVLLYATNHFDLLTGATGSGKSLLLAIIWGVTAFGVVLALVLKSQKPEIYARIGRQ
jgi:amino acid transporter